MRIKRIGWRGYRIPFRQQFVTAGNRAAVRHGLLVWTTADNGATGIGEASPPYPNDEASTSKCVAELRRFATSLLGVQVEAVPAKIRTAAEEGLDPALAFGVETATYDLLGAEKERPVAYLLGGRPRAIAVNAVIGVDSTAQAIREAVAAVEAGFTTLKVKVGMGTLKADLQRLDAIRQRVGKGVKIRIDANQAWNVEEAVAAICQLGDYELEYVEQPVPTGDIDGLAAVRRRVSTPIAADESILSAAHAHRLLRAEAADVLVIKAARVGGLRASIEVAALAADAGKRVVVTSALESGIGLAASLHLAAALPSEGPASGLATGPLLESDLLKKPLVAAGGTIPALDGHGLGVTLDHGEWERYATPTCGSEEG